VQLQQLCFIFRILIVLFNCFFFKYRIRSGSGYYLFAFGFVEGIIFLPGDKVNFVLCKGGKLLTIIIALVEGKE